MSKKLSTITPPPWTVERLMNDERLYIVRRRQKGEKYPLHGSAGAICQLSKSAFHNQQLNAALISAAPDLLEALVALIPLAESAISEPSSPHVNASLVDAAKAAVSKATVI